MKKICILALAMLTLIFTSCSDVEAELELFRSEFDDIKEFFSDEISPSALIPSVHAVLAQHSASSAPIPISVLHTEAFQSVYNNAVENVPSISAADRNGYVTVPRFSSYSKERVCTELEAHGITPNIIKKRNPSPAGDVFAIEYAGVSDENVFCINSTRPVTLYVSADKPAVNKPAEDGSNVVYLTYDDGPTEVGTKLLLDILDTYGVKATFFMTGEAIGRCPESAKAAASRGHIVGCHSTSHVYSDIYSSAEAMREEVIGWERAAAEAGITVDDAHKLFRYPGGSVGGYVEDELRTEINGMLGEMSYRIYDWNVVTNDAVLYTAPDGVSSYDYIKSSFAETFETRVKTKQAPIIILMHETVTETVDLMPWMLEYLISRGYAFATLDSIDSWMFGG